MLTALAGNDEIKIAIVKEGGIELVLSGMTQHQVSFFYLFSGYSLEKAPVKDIILVYRVP